jgi:hypothetical protein
LFEKYEDPSRWFFDGLTDENQAEILRKYEANESKGIADATMETILNRVNNHLPAIEMPEQIRARFDRFAEQVKEVVRTHSGRVALVTHSIMVQSATASPNSPMPTYDPTTTWITFPPESVYPENNQFLAFDEFIFT